MQATTRQRRARALLAVATLLALGAAAARAQTPGAASAASDARLRAGRDELTRARQERAGLEAQLRVLQDTAHDLRVQAAAFDRRAGATARLVGALDRQLAAMHAEVEAASVRYDQVSGELARQQVGLRRRLVDIYKRGPLSDAEALLSAASFADLVARYKYLHELARRDRTLVRRVERLRNDVAAQRALLVRLQIELARNRDEKAAEETELRRFEAQRGQSLAQVEGRAARTRDRIAQLARDEARVSSLLAEIEAARKRREAAARLAATRAAARDAALREAAAREASRREAARLAARNAAARANGRRPEVAVRPPEPVTTTAASPAATAPAPERPALAIAAAAPTSFSWPLRGPLLYRFGRVVGANNTATRWNGVGISAAPGTPVHAAAAGRVAVAQSIGSYGQTVILQHEGGDYSVYGSLARVDVQVGDAVQRGQVIGAVGAADPDLPAHLHFELRPQGHATDPLALLGGR
ncbi:hypothetical protein tb265_33930 [Gemmatimonadetes bacterium T265]|nr:hypothetical protein tb265_33930 [Gemmatimonadetes bacterium T265]